MATHTRHQSNRPNAADEQPAPDILADNGNADDGAASVTVVIIITTAVGIYNH
jgi:hypothetical protein